MADPLKQICDELGVCKEEALFYLEGFGWDLNAALEACRSKTLPPTKNERSTAEERSRNERAAAEERSRNERAAAEEGSRNELIAQFLAIAPGSSAEDAVKYLSDSNWNLQHAGSTFYDDSEKKSKNPTASHDGNTETWYPEGWGSDVMQDVLSKVPTFHNASMDLRIRSTPPSASTPPPPLELKEESINKFLEVLSEATSQDAIYCLNKRKGNVEDAVGYFYGDYSKSRPGIATAQVVKNFSGRAVDKDSSTESPQHIPEAKTLVTSSQVEESGNPTETLPLKEEESGEVNEEHIGTFVKMTGASREDAIANLEHFKWNVNQAVEFYKENGYSAELISALSFSLTENKDPPLPSMGEQSQLDASSGPTETESSLEKAGEGDVTVANPGMAKAHVKIQESSSPPHTREGTSLNKLLNSLKHDDIINFFIEGAGGKVTRDSAIFYLTLSNWDVNKAFSYLTEGEETTQVQASEEGETGSSSSSINADPTETGNVTVAVPDDATSLVDENVKDKAVEEELGTELAAVPITSNTETWYPEGWGSDVMLDVLSKVPTFHNTDLRIGSPPSASTPPFELKQESIKAFHEFASEASPTAILDCLNHCQGIVENAVKYFYDVYSLGQPSEAVKEELLASFSSTTGETRQVANVYLEQYKWNLSRATDSFFDHRDSSFPMEIQSSPEEDVTVAIPPGMASSQVDGKAVEEGSSAGASRGDRTTVETQTAPSTIMMTISLADGRGTELELPLRSNQTIRDIRNAIDQQYPDNDRSYYLQSIGGEVYMDWDTTVDRVSTGGCRVLLQTYP